jgi:hypothetical protein
MKVDQVQLDPRVRLGQRCGGLRHDRAQHRSVGRQANPTGLQSDLRCQFLGRRVDASHNLGRPVGKQLPFRSQSDPTTDALNELRAGSCFQTRQVVARRRLRVVELISSPRREGRAPASAGCGSQGVPSCAGPLPARTVPRSRTSPECRNAVAVPEQEWAQT